MSSQAKEVVRVMGEELEKFEADNIALRRTNINRMGGQTGHRSEFTEWFDVPYVSRTIDGLNIANFEEITGLAVPHRVNIFATVPFKLTNSDTLDTTELSRKMRSAMQAIDNRINRAVANAVVNQGSQFVSSTTALSGFQNVADVETRFIEQDVSQLTDKTMILNPGDYNSMASNLQDLSRSIQTGSISETAYEKARIAEIANFMTFKTSFAPTKAAAAGGGAITVTGTQNFTPEGNTLDSEGNPTNVDNRVMNLVVSATAGVVVGDKFTIAGVNASSMQNKNDTGNLRTFTVTAIVDGTNLTISPPVIFGDVNPPLDTDDQSRFDWQNCAAAAAGGSSIVFLNIVTGQTNPFWENDAISINVAPVVGSENDLGGMILMNETTDLGLNVIVAKQGAIADLSTEWRVTTFFGVTIRDPLKCGILMGSQV